MDMAAGVLLGLFWYYTTVLVSFALLQYTAGISRADIWQITR